MNGTEDVANVFKNISDVNFLYIALIIISAWLITIVSQRLLPWIANKFAGRVRLFVLGLVPILRLVVIIVAFILLVPQVIEPSFENLVAMLGALGLALGFAFKDYVSSLIAGVVTLYEMPYRPGDWIEIEGSYGEVKEINMRSVEIITPEDTVVTIPHIKLWNSSILNSNDGSHNLMCIADFYLDPAHDGAQVKHKLYDVALSSAYLKLEKPISVIVMEKPWGTHYRLKAYPIDPRQQFNFITDMTIRGKEALLKLEVKFATTPFLNQLN